MRTIYPERVAKSVLVQEGTLVNPGLVPGKGWQGGEVCVVVYHDDQPEKPPWFVINKTRGEVYYFTPEQIASAAP